MRLYLFHIETQTFLCSARHNETVVEVAADMVGVEYRLVLDDSVEAFGLAHFSVDEVVIECPPHLNDDVLQARLAEAKLRTQEHDRIMDLRKLSEDGVVIGFFPAIKDGMIDNDLSHGRD